MIISFCAKPLRAMAASSYRLIDAGKIHLEQPAFRAVHLRSNPDQSGFALRDRRKLL